jgi:hypothetical protein
VRHQQSEIAPGASSTFGQVKNLEKNRKSINKHMTCERITMQYRVIEKVFQSDRKIYSVEGMTEMSGEWRVEREHSIGSPLLFSTLDDAKEHISKQRNREIDSRWISDEIVYEEEF